MIQNKILKLLQKTITTLTCFWMLTTQMPINVVFADEINTEENIVEDINENEINNVDNGEDDQIINEEDDEINDERNTKTSNNQESLNEDVVNDLNNEEQNNINNEQINNNEEINIDAPTTNNKPKLLLGSNLQANDTWWGANADTFNNSTYGLGTKNGNYYISNPENYITVNGTITINAGVTVTIDLCGAYIGAPTNGPLFIVYGTLNLKNASSTNSVRAGIIEGRVNASHSCQLIRVESGGTLNVNPQGANGIYIKENHSPSYGGAVYVKSGGTFNLKDPHTTIYNCYEANGGGVLNQGTFNMYAGTISDCKAQGNETNYGGGAVYNSGTFNMYGGTIENCSANLYGGGVLNFSTFNMYGGTINGCKAPYGGGVFNKGTFNMYGAGAYNSVTTSGAVIQNCEATGDKGLGGGVFADANSTTVIDGGIISGCKSSWLAGGIYQTAASTVTLKEGTISNCSASVDGGGFYVDHRSTLNIADGEITGCTSGKNGGGIYLVRNSNDADQTTSKYTTLNMTGGTISNCTANEHGGGVCATNPFGKVKFNMTGGTIENCTSNTGDGGGISIHNSAEVVMSNSTIQGCKTLNTSTSGNGGGIALHDSTKLEMSNSTVKNNTASRWSGGIQVTGSAVVTISNSQIINNTATAYGGGGINNDNTVTVSDTIITGNTCGGEGKQIRNTKNLTIKDYCTIDNGTNDLYQVTNNITKTKITFDKQGGTGGTDEVDPATYNSAMPKATIPELNDHEFLGYFDKPDGGTQYYNADGTSARNWDKIIVNTTLYAHWTHYHDEITFEPWDGTPKPMPTTAGNYYLTKDITFTGSWEVPLGTTNLCLNGHIINLNGEKNIKINSGAILNLYDCDNITEHYFTYGQKDYWALIFSPTDQQKVNAISFDNITSSTANGAVIKLPGGAITGGTGGYGNVEIVAGTFTMKNGNIVGHNATGSGIQGGGVRVSGSGTFNMNGGLIAGCKVGAEGGGVICYSGSKIIMTDGTIAFNISLEKDGGGVYNEGSFTMSGGTIKNNTAYNGGGGVYVKGTTFTMEGGTISNNNADHGAGICCYNSTSIKGIIDISGDSSITYNTAIKTGSSTESFGGGIYIGGGSLEMNGGNISNNKSDNGGGIAIRTDGNSATIKNAKISKNTAIWGGGLYFAIAKTDKVIISDNTLIFNNIADKGSNAESWGGGIYVSGGELTLTGITIKENIADNGGGISLKYGNSSAIMSDSTIIDNTATWGGGVALKDSAHFVLKEKGIIKSNEASSKGGGVYVTGDGTTFNTDVTDHTKEGIITENVATDGNQIYKVSGQGNATLNGFVTVDNGTNDLTSNVANSTTKSYITFDKQGGTGGWDYNNSQSYGQSMNAASPSTVLVPTRDGYVFAGYYDAPTDGKQYYAADGSSNVVWDKIIANTTLYAHWNVVIPTAITGLTYNGQEQTGVAKSEGYTLTDNKATNAGTYAAKAKLKEGYVWSDGTTEDKTITFTIDKKDISGSKIELDSYEDYSDKPVEPKIKSVTTLDELNIPSTDYSISYSNNTLTSNDWHYGKVTITANEESSFIGSADVEFKIEKKKCRISFVTNGGINLEDKEEFFGTILSPSSFTKPTKDGYDFSWWYTDESLNTELELNYIIKNDITLFAKYKLKDYSITYTLNGGTANNPTTYNIESDSFTLSNPTKEGYVFTGWTGTGLSEKTSTVTIEKGSIDNREYTAHYDTCVDKPVAIEDLTYTGSEQNGVVLSNAYKLENNTATTPGKYEVTAILNEGYVWSDGTRDNIVIPFTIKNADFESASISFAETTYNGQPQGENNTVSVETVDNCEFAVKYRTSDNGEYNLTSAPTFTNAGEHTVYYEITAANHNTYNGSYIVKINQLDISNATITLDSANNNYFYSGTPITPVITSIIINGISLTSSDYSVSYSTQTIDADYLNDFVTATLTITPTNSNFSGTKSKQFDIYRKFFNFTYELNGGTCSTLNPGYSYGRTANLFGTEPIKIGYKFVEWNTKADGTGDHYALGDSVNVEEDITFYAIWEEKEVIAEITNSNGTVKYYSFIEAVNGAKAGDTIKFINDTTECDNITINKNITIDLNGNDVGENYKGKIYVEESTVVIKGSGTLYHDIYAQNNGTVIIPEECDDLYLYNLFTGNNSGKLEINSGNFLGNSGIDVYSGSTVTINYVTYSYILRNKGTNITINDGDFGKIYTQSNGTTTINDGTFVEVKSEGGTTNINGGYFASNPTPTSGTLVINGGKYVEEPNGELISEGHLIDSINETKTYNSSTYTFLYSVISGYSIEYKLNDGVFDNPDDVPTIYENGKSISLPIPMKEMYEFDGWYYDEQLTNKVENAETFGVNETGNKVLYAKWSKNKCETSFVWNNGTSDVYDKIIETYNSKYVLPEEKPTREGYEFDGWFTDTTSGTKVTTETNVNKIDDHTLYAHWTANKYKVIYDNNKDSVHVNITGTTAASTFTFDGTNNKTAANGFTAPGYTFKGWNTKKDGTGIDYAASTVTTNNLIENPSNSGNDSITLYAKWDVNPEDSVWEAKVTSEEALTNGIKKNGTNDYYFTSFTNALVKAKSGQTVVMLQDITLTAAIDSLTSGITIDLNEHILGSNSNAGARIFKEVGNFSIKNGELKCNYPTGYSIFEGGTNIVATDVDFNAVSSASQVAYNGTKLIINGGSVTNNSMLWYENCNSLTITINNNGNNKFKFNGSELISKNLKPDNYTLTINGGLFNVNPSNNIDNNHVVISATEQDYQYEVVEGGIVTYNSNGGTTVPNTNKYTKSSGLVDSLATTTRIGYTFVGWYDDDNKVENAEYFKDKTGPIELIAKWEVNPEDSHWFASSNNVNENQTVGVKGSDDLYYFTSIKDALNNSAEKSTVKLLQSITLDSSITSVPNKVTIDLDGKTLGGLNNHNDNARIFSGVTNAFTVENGTLSINTDYGYSSFNNCSNVTVNDIKFIAPYANALTSNQELPQVACYNTFLTINGGSVEGNISLAFDGKETIVINNSSTNKFKFNGNKITHSGNANLTINGGLYKYNPSEYVKNPERVVIAANETGYNYEVVEGGKITFALNDGTLPSGYSNPAIYTKESGISLPTPTRTEYVFDGWYTDSDLTTIVTNTTSFGQGETGPKTLYAKWITAIEAAIAKTESNSRLTNAVGFENGYSYYDTLAKAISDATNTETKITLLKDVTEHDLIINIGQNVTLDLNGKTINANHEGRLFINKGTLTINDYSDEHTGKLINGRYNGVKNNDNTSAGNGIRNEGILNINGGTISGCTSTEAWNAGRGGAIFSIGSGSIVNFNGGSITNSNALYGGAIYVTERSSLVMSNDAVIEGCSNTAYVWGGGAIHIYKGSATINGGTIKNCTSAGSGGAIYIHNSELTINNVLIDNCKTVNGDLEPNINGAQAIEVDCTDGDSTITITGGIIKCNDSTKELIVIGENKNNHTITNNIIDGWYSKEITPADGYKIVGPIDNAEDRNAPYSIERDTIEVYTYTKAIVSDKDMSAVGHVTRPNNIYRNIETNITAVEDEESIYRFDHWEINGINVGNAKELAYTFTDDVTNVFAVYRYELSNGIRVHVEAEKPFTMKIMEKQKWLFWDYNIDAIYNVNKPNNNGLYDKEIRVNAGSQVEISYANTNNDFVAWTSENGVVRYNEPTYLMNAIYVEQNIKLQTKVKTDSNHYVRFVNVDDQILKIGEIRTLEELNSIKPNAPGKLGYKFIDWLINDNLLGDIETNEQLQKIIQTLDVIEIKPKFEKLPDKYKVTANTVVGDEISQFNTDNFEYALGDVAHLSAPKVEGYVFAYWTIDNKIVSYTETYAHKVLNHVTICANYEENEIEKKITLTANVVKGGSVDNEKISFVVTRSVPEDMNQNEEHKYSIVENGILYSTLTGWDECYTTNEEREAKFKFDGVDEYGNVRLTNISKVTFSNNSYNGNITGTFATKTNLNKVFYIRGYIIVEFDDGSLNGSMKTIYTDLYRVTYNTINQPTIIQVTNN